MLYFLVLNTKTLHKIWSDDRLNYFMFLLKRHHRPQVLRGNSCLANALLLHDPSFLFLHIRLELVEAPGFFQPSLSLLRQSNQLFVFLEK